MDDREFEELDDLNDLEGLEDLDDLNESRETEIEEEQWQHQDPFTALMFGTRRPPPPIRDMQNNQPWRNQMTYQPAIDYEAIMVNIDTLIESVRGLKPLFQQIYPHIEKLWKK